jgi:2-polyprenyl-3-methyl-5-hydroxy-6-metoxy-1,4-benzoquinol methylase
MSTATEHYTQHLAPIYLWMAGGAQTALQAGSDEIATLSAVLPAEGNVVDLGAGFGMHAIPLARAGFKVTAIDTSTLLLETLEQLCGDLPILTINDDLLNFQNHLDEPPTAVFCMGDTLTHLPSITAVHTLFERLAAAFSEGGVFVTTFRDYSIPLSGDQRFIPVRSDASRILTCFLEYQSETVLVHDILHECQEDQWHTRISHYPKLKLTPAMVCKWLESYGFTVDCSLGLRGMQRLVANY